MGVSVRRCLPDRWWRDSGLGHRRMLQPGVGMESPQRG